MAPDRPTIAEDLMDDIETRIHDICAEALQLKQVPIDDDLISLGADSMVAVEIVTKVEQEFGVDVMESFFLTPSVGHIARLVQVERMAG
jgi:acyl carrier protein